MTGAEFRGIRQRAGCSQQHLAFMLEIHPVTVSRYENDRDPIPRRLAILMRLLDLR